MLSPSFSVSWLVVLSLVLYGTVAKGLEYYGRATLGSYVSIEDHSEVLDGATRNDFATGSARIYLRLSKMGSANFEFVGDLKEKYDLYEELDRAALALEAANELQFRQLYFGDDRAFSNFYYKIGRLPVSSVGGAFVDGIEAGSYLFSKFWRLGFMTGADPQVMGQSYLDFNSKAQIIGAYIDYKYSQASWNRFFQASLAYVQKTYAGEVDRQYIYEDFLFQWARNSRVQAMSYLDLVPHTNVQNLSVIYSHALTSQLDIDLRLIGIDVIEYRRQQEIRETLTPSPYQEVRGKVQYQFLPKVWVGVEARSGTRSVDNLTLTTGELYFRMPRLFSKQIDLYQSLGWQDRFGHKGIYAKAGGGYFRDLWEASAVIEYRAEELVSGEQLHPLIAEGTLGLNFSRDIFSALTFQYAVDERVTISSLFMKIGYRFGQRLEAPLRDSAPIRGRM